MCVVPGIKVLVGWLEVRNERESGYLLVYVGSTVVVGGREEGG
jgi:hypothetical protein